MIANAGGCFGLALETTKATDGDTIPPGSILVKGNVIHVFLPASKDPFYFSALMLWTRFAGDDAPKYAKDIRLPDFVRKTIAGLTK